MSITGAAPYYDVEDLKPKPGSEYDYWRQLLQEDAMAQTKREIEESQEKLNDMLTKKEKKDD